MNSCWQITVQKLGAYKAKKKELDTRDEESEETCEIGGRRFGKGTHYELLSTRSRSFIGLFRREAINLLVNKEAIMEVQRNGHLLSFAFQTDAWDTEDKAVQWQIDQAKGGEVEPEPPKWLDSAAAKGKQRFKEPYGIESSNVRIFIWQTDSGTQEPCLYRVQVSPTQRGKR